MRVSQNMQDKTGKIQPKRKKYSEMLFWEKNDYSVTSLEDKKLLDLLS